MKRASYRHAIKWIALNDSSGDVLDEEELSSLVTSLLVADIFGVEPERVGHDLMQVRRANGTCHE
jgi:hypothetical protein